MIEITSVLNVVVQGGSFALLAWVFIYWLPKAVERANSEVARNRESVEKLVDRFVVERENDRQSRHAMNTTFAETLAKVLTENKFMAERIETAIVRQTDKLEGKMDLIVAGLLLGNRDALDKMAKEQKK